MRDAARAQRVTLSSTISLRRAGSTSWFPEGVELDHDVQGEAFVGLSASSVRASPRAPRSASSTAVRRRPVELQKSLPLGTGLGYRVGGFTSGDQTGGSGAFQYQTPVRTVRGPLRSRERRRHPDDRNLGRARGVGRNVGDDPARRRELRADSRAGRPRRDRRPATNRSPARTVAAT